MHFLGNDKHYRWAPERRRLPSIWRRVLRSDRPKHSGSVFAARCTLYACRPQLVNGYLTQLAPGDTTVGTTPSTWNWKPECTRSDPVVGLRCVRKGVFEMREAPSEPVCGARLQTTLCGLG